MASRKRLPCIIPARGGSKGIPRKNIVALHGRPLIAWALGAARSAASVDAVYVSTEDPEIAEIAATWGASVIDRPRELATDETSSEAVLFHALEQLAGRHGALPETFVFVQCTSPLVTADDIDGAVSMLFDKNADSVVGVRRENVFLWRQKSDRTAEPVNHSRSYRPRRQELEPQFVETGAVYAIRSDAMLRERTRYCGKVRLFEMPLIHTFEVDQEEDLPLVELLLRARESDA